MQHAPAQEPPQNNLEMSLRRELLAQSGGPPTASAPHPYPLPPPAAAARGTDNPYQASDSGSPHDPNIDPNVAGNQQIPYGMSGDNAGNEDPNADKNKRELSTSKRAAQNRAAQRAFRQRKEAYINKLEEQVEEFKTMEQSFRLLQNENFQLRDYILNLQSRLLENDDDDFPPAPAHVNLPPNAAGSASASTRHSVPSELAEHMRQVQMQAQTRERVRPETADQLQATAARVSDELSRPPHHSPPHSSPYGAGSEYPNKRAREEEPPASAESEAS